MIEGLLFDRVHAESARFSVSSQNQHSAFIFADPAEPLLSFCQGTESRTEKAFDSAVIHGFPVTGRVGGGGDRSHVNILASNGEKDFEVLIQIGY